MFSGVTNDVNMALQRRDQDLLNALTLVKICKARVQKMRDDGWEALLGRVVTVCTTHDIHVPNMDGPYHLSKRSHRQTSFVTNLHHYKTDCLVSILDLQLK
ncbi:unnamed protein product, partial [Cuscuta europaea]